MAAKLESSCFKEIDVSKRASIKKIIEDKLGLSWAKLSCQLGFGSTMK